MTFDLIIRHGQLIDGSGADAYPADVGITADRIVALGPLSEASATCEIDATGCVVAPGFIDAHAHSDAYLLIEPDAPSKLSQGITTEVNGQCGGSAVPRLGQARLSSDWASQTYPRLTEQGLVPSNTPGPTWQTVADYRRLFDAVRPALNTVQMIGHNTLRAGVMGYDPRPATPDELREMSRRLTQALEEGGWGLSTGLIYQPGKYATEDEVLALTRTAAEQGGMFATHMRSEGDRLLESVQQVIELSRATNIRVQISHLKTAGKENWHKIDACLDLFKQAHAEGLPVGSDRYPYLASGTDLDVLLPDWASAGGRDAILKNLRTPETRERIIHALNTSTRDWSSVMIGGGWHEEVRVFSGRTLIDTATELKLSPGETVCRFIDLDDTRTGAFFFGMCQENLHRIYSESWIMPGSDASLRAPWGPLGQDHPHPRAYGTMPRFLRLLTGAESGFAKICCLEEAIRRMTSLPAQTFGIRQRGTLTPGYFADLVVFNAKTFRERSTYASPHQFAEGLRQVIVNGVTAFDCGTFTGKRSGRFLTR